MERRFRDASKENKTETTNMQKKLAERRRFSRQPEPEPAPDLTELMNDWFFGNTNKEQKAYQVGGGILETKEEEDGRKHSSSSNSKLTQEWLEEAKRMVASSPSRHGSPSRLVGSPRFATAYGNELNAASSLDRRDPLSRSARRHRSVESFSGEILSKSAKHVRNKSEAFEPLVEKSPASAVQQWFTKILKPNHPANEQKLSDLFEELDHEPNQTAQTRLPRQPIRRKSRFQDDTSEAQTTSAKPISRRTFKPQAAETETQVLSPPRHLNESAHRRSISSSTCSFDRVAKKEVEVVGPGEAAADLRLMEGVEGRLNLFLKEQRAKMGRVLKGESSTNAKIVFSGSSNSTSSMVATICYAWLLENKEKKEEGWEVVVPVMNMKRGRMWKQRQAAWLFHHVGVDATSLLFSDEVDLETMLMARQLSILVVGQDVLKTNGEVGSQCTILTDNYCEYGYDLLQTPFLKKMLLAGILLDTLNLNFAAKFSTNRDAEAVQLLLVGSTPNLRHDLYEQLMQDQQDNSFLETMRSTYGKPSNTVIGHEENDGFTDHRVSARNSALTTYQHMNLGIAERTIKTKVDSSKSGNNANGGLIENRIRKSTSSTYQDLDTGNTDAVNGDMRNLMTKTTPPNSGKQNKSSVPPPPPATAQAGEAARPKNKFFLAKWFGFGSK